MRLLFRSLCHWALTEPTQGEGRAARAASFVPHRPDVPLRSLRRARRRHEAQEQEDAEEASNSLCATSSDVCFDPYPAASHQACSLDTVFLSTPPPTWNYRQRSRTRDQGNGGLSSRRGRHMARVRRPAAALPGLEALDSPLGYTPTKRVQRATVTPQQNISTSRRDAHR